MKTKLNKLYKKVFLKSTIDNLKWRLSQIVLTPPPPKPAAPSLRAQYISSSRNSYAQFKMDKKKHAILKQLIHFLETTNSTPQHTMALAL